MIHNGLGYLLGYWGAYVSGLEESARRTVAIEVGMQNCGMATGLAINVLKNVSVALPAAIFGPWMSISGALLAAWWQGSEVDTVRSPMEKPL
jgi:BASS family bile acid:Na+ symporter